VKRLVPSNFMRFPSSRFLTTLLMLVLGLVVFTSGCARKIVRPEGPQPGVAGPYPAGPVAEHGLQALQANLNVVYFSYDNFTLTPEAQGALQSNVQILRRAPQMRIVAEGHCDERGTDEYNLALGERRSRAVVSYLAELGIPASQMSTVSYGAELPVDPGHNEAAWAKNRRVYLRVVH